MAGFFLFKKKSDCELFKMKLMHATYISSGIDIEWQTPPFFT